MITEPVFNTQNNKVVIPWKDYRLSDKQIIVLTSVLGTLIIAVGLFDNFDFANTLKIAAGCVALTPLFLYFMNFLFSKNPFAPPLTMDMNGITASSISFLLYHKTHISWTDVSRVEHIMSMVGHNVAPIEYNLMIYMKNGRSQRIFIPRLNPKEREQFFVILEAISKHYGFDLVIE